MSTNDNELSVTCHLLIKGDECIGFKLTALENDKQAELFCDSFADNLFCSGGEFGFDDEAKNVVSFKNPPVGHVHMTVPDELFTTTKEWFIELGQIRLELTRPVMLFIEKRDGAWDTEIPLERA
ncbi:MAG: hypothetical protein KC877_03145 [Candidatus Kaiserbacteria bacterium]|nr:hypothetical protein [Candidatus Kaiserbacteria bacterium]MCB9815791.1 hypothetical protein [Candidatus Nomurabacteria bacterium]